MDNEIQGCPVTLAQNDEAQSSRAEGMHPESNPKYEDLPQLITSLQASHARVFRSMDVVVHAHAIPYFGTLTSPTRA